MEVVPGDEGFAGYKRRLERLNSTSVRISSGHWKLAKMTSTTTVLLTLALASCALAYVIPLSHTVQRSSNGYYMRLRQADTCPQPGFYQDNDNCQKFYRCAEHYDNETESYIVNKHEFFCPPGTVFDEAETSCNHAYAVADLKKECLAAVEAELEEIRNRPAPAEEEGVFNQQGNQQPPPSVILPVEPERPGTVVVVPQEPKPTSKPAVIKYFQENIIKKTQLPQVQVVSGQATTNGQKTGAIPAVAFTQGNAVTAAQQPGTFFIYQPQQQQLPIQTAYQPNQLQQQLQYQYQPFGYQQAAAAFQPIFVGQVGQQQEQQLQYKNAAAAGGFFPVQVVPQQVLSYYAGSSNNINGVEGKIDPRFGNRYNQVPAIIA